MSAQYLLPCRCGHSIVVEPRRAGEMTVCPACGASQQVPTMREMADLEPAPRGAQRSPAGAAWQWQQQALLLGAVLVIAAIVLGIVFFVKRPIPDIDNVDPDRIRQSAQKFTPLVTWHYWTLMKQGLDRRIDQRYTDRLAIYRIQLAFAGVVGLTGAGLIVAGAAMGRKERGGDGGRGRRGDKKSPS